MEKKPKVTIVIPVYNGSKYVKEAIDSALNQTYKNIEIIVVNDGSTDKTEKIVLSYGDEIKYYKKENGGVSTALNLAIKNMNGEYFSWLSHDDIYYKDKIEKQISYLSLIENKETVLYSNYDFIDGKGRYFREPIIHDHELLITHPEFALLRGCINGITLLIPKVCFDKYGLFDETLKCTQDYDKWLEIFKSYPFVHMNEVLAATRLHKKQETNTNPLVITEGNLFWVKLIESFSDEKKIELCGSIENYYVEMIEFLEKTPYSDALTHCRKKMKF